MISVNFSEEVQTALSEKRPVLALESTIIAHGMPYPRNMETALLVEKTVRDAGVTPATCAIINGELKAGLSEKEIELLGKGGSAIPKASRRDIAWLVSQKRSGATTVASTMIIAHMAGIRIFATGGIGGVHRGATRTMDISADLQELARTPVAVVSAGAKSILDLGLTLEYLETMGVPVLGYQTDEFPAFYTRRSGLGVDYRVESPAEIAKLLQTHWGLGLSSGAIIANPIPASFELDPDEMERCISLAVKEAENNGIHGKQLSPFLLAKVEALTNGKSLETNIALVLNNVRLGAEIAKALLAISF